MAKNVRRLFVESGSATADHQTGDQVTLQERQTDELVFGLVGPIASGVSKTAKIIKEILEDEFGYKADIFTVSDYIIEATSLVDGRYDQRLTGAKRVFQLQDLGNKLREQLSPEYLAQKVVAKIAAHRGDDKDAFTRVADSKTVAEPVRKARIVDSLKNPAEVRLLKEVYGDVFWLIGVFAPENLRKLRLKSKKFDDGEIGSVIERDRDDENDFGQRVTDTIHLADFFVRNGSENEKNLRGSVARILDVLFNASVTTPTRDESGMYVAASAAARSGCLSRQVGASIYSQQGELLGIGWNDVPEAGGGLYSIESEPDNRCFQWSEQGCHNDLRKQSLYAEAAAAVQTSIEPRVKHAITEKLTPLFRETATAEQIESALVQVCSSAFDAKELASVLQSTEIRNLIEYSRAVHAEMEAIISIARGGRQGLCGATLYCTCFPCHSCARHIVASGIRRVVYIEPYPKSLALDLHRDAIKEEDDPAGKAVSFVQYEGIAPKNMARLFHHGSERKSEGKLLKRQKKELMPVFPPPIDGFTHREGIVISLLHSQEQKRGKGQSQAIESR